MALVPCPECQKKISERAVFCPSCGFPLSLPNLHSMTRQNESNPEDSVTKHFLRSNPMEISPQQLIASKQFYIFSKKDWSNKSPGDRFTHRWEWEFLINGRIQINNEFISTVKGTVFDRATGLMWQHSGSKQALTWDEACKYIIWLNKSRFCNFADWRLPTIEELASLFGNGKWVYAEECWDVTTEVGFTCRTIPFSVDFDQKQIFCWSCDIAAPGEWTCPNRDPDRLSDYVRLDIPPNSVWAINFGDGPFSGIWTGILRPSERCEYFWVRAVRTKLTNSG
jgi:hypothetical protein